MASAGDSLWVFGYGSLMWEPGFPFAEQHRARLDGYARRFRLLSVLYRGTVERPGLVLGLDHVEGGHCVGIVYRVAPGDVVRTLDYLHAREMVTYAYREVRLPVSLLGADGTECADVLAVCYVLDRDHAQYAGEISDEECAAMIVRAHGAKGPNRIYFEETLRQLESLGVREEGLERIWGRVQAQIGDGP